MDHLRESRAGGVPGGSGVGNWAPVPVPETQEGDAVGIGRGAPLHRKSDVGGSYRESQSGDTSYPIHLCLSTVDGDYRLALSVVKPRCGVPSVIPHRCHVGGGIGGGVYPRFCSRLWVRHGV